MTKLADYLNCPIVTSAGHGDAIPYDYKLNAGQMGPRGNPVATKLMKEADVILALGTRLGFNSTFYSYDNISKSAKIIQIDIDPISIGRYFPVEIGIQGDVKIFFCFNAINSCEATEEASASIPIETRKYLPIIFFSNSI